MRKILCITIIFSLGYGISGQSLQELYQKGTIKLVPDETFAAGNDWDHVFASYNDSMMNKHIGARKSLIIKSDGSFVVSHAYRDYYTLFDPNGRFVKEFGVTNKNGGREKGLKSIDAIISGNTFIAGADNMGRMRCFDFNGNMIKTLTLNYSVRDLIVLDDHRLAVSGWVIWKEKFRNFVSIVDYDTNKEKIIWDHFTDRASCDDKPGMFNYSVRFEKGGMMSFNTMPYTQFTGNNYSPGLMKIGEKLVVAVPGSGEIISFSFDGNQMKKEKAGWDAGSISVEEQKEIQEKHIQMMKANRKERFASDRVSEEESEKIVSELIRQMESDMNLISEPISKPYFSTIIKDSDDNLLFFEYPEERGENRFHVMVYNKNGEFINNCSFVCDEYDLSINPRKMVFRDGYIYGLQNLKGAEGIPMRLVRFRLEPGD